MTLVCNFIYFLLILTVELCSGVIYRLNDTEFYKMPPVFHLDSYDECLNDPDGLYCTADFTLVSDTPSPLLDMIREYSEFTPKHFNHSKLTYGVCVSSTCNDFYVNKTADPRLTLEACLNESMWDKYKLKTKVSDDYYCYRNEESMVIDTLDIVVAVIIGTVVLLNLVGSFYDICFAEQDDEKGNKFLLCFSLRRNWCKLKAPAADGPEERLKRLVSVNAVKAFTTVFVVMAHAIVATGYCVHSTLRLEKLYDLWPIHIIINGTIIVQAFLVVSGFLLIYNLQLHMETHERHWSLLPKLTLMRWLRLTPPYAIVVAYIMTWNRFTGSGPFWKKAALVEVSDCRQHWWQHLLYINNYIDGSSCTVHTWYVSLIYIWTRYLATDTQLYILGIIVFLTCRRAASRAVVLSLLFLAGLVIPAVITYYKDLDGLLMTSPEVTRGLFIMNQTFQQMYVRGYTNMTSYVIGMALGYLVYHAQKRGFDVNKYKWYRCIYWASLPIAIGVMILGQVFYLEAPRTSVYIRALAAALLKPTFSFLVAIGIAACVFKCENVYRSIAEWEVWTPLSRLTYSAYLLHATVLRYELGTQTALLQVSYYLTTINVFGSICISFIAACVFWLLVEAPCGRLAKVLLM